MSYSISYACLDRIICSNIPPHQGALGRLNLHLIPFLALYLITSLPLKLNHYLTTSNCATNDLWQRRYELVVRSGESSKWIILDEAQVVRVMYPLLVLLKSTLIQTLKKRTYLSFTWCGKTFHHTSMTSSTAWMRTIFAFNWTSLYASFSFIQTCPLNSL